MQDLHTWSVTAMRSEPGLEWLAERKEGSRRRDLHQRGGAEGFGRAVSKYGLSRLEIAYESCDTYPRTLLIAAQYLDRFGVRLRVDWCGESE